MRETDVEESVASPPPAVCASPLVFARLQVEMFAACRRADGLDTHFDVRWQDGVLSFTGKLELLPQGPSMHVQELAMYDDYINYYGFPRELGFIRTKQARSTSPPSLCPRPCDP